MSTIGRLHSHGSASSSPRCTLASACPRSLLISCNLSCTQPITVALQRSLASLRIASGSFIRTCQVISPSISAPQHAQSTRLAVLVQASSSSSSQQLSQPGGVLYSRQLVSAMRTAREAAARYGCLFAEPDMLLLGILQATDCPAADALRRSGISTEALSARLDSQLVAPVVGVLRPNDVELSPATRQAVQYAQEGAQAIAQQQQEQQQRPETDAPDSAPQPMVTTAHVLVVLLQAGDQPLAPPGRTPGSLTRGSSASGLQGGAGGSGASACSLSLLVNAQGSEAQGQLEEQLLDLCEVNAGEDTLISTTTASKQANEMVLELVSQYKSLQAKGKLDPSTFRMPAATGQRYQEGGPMYRSSDEEDLYN